jgi:hypothetical protein
MLWRTKTVGDGRGRGRVRNGSRGGEIKCPLSELETPSMASGSVEGTGSQWRRRPVSASRLGRSCKFLKTQTEVSSPGLPTSARQWMAIGKNCRGPKTRRSRRAVLSLASYLVWKARGVASRLPTRSRGCQPNARRAFSVCFEACIIWTSPDMVGKKEAHETRTAETERC